MIISRLWHFFALALWPCHGHCKYAGARGPQKFQRFLSPESQHTLWEINAEICANTLLAYIEEWETLSSRDRLDSLCMHHQECILDNMSENKKSYMSSSSLVLGLSPIMMSSLGPTISEIGLLSLNRPLLSLLLTFGTVGVYPSRILGYKDDSPLDIILQPSLLPERGLRWIIAKRWRAGLVVTVEYIVVAVAIFNVCYTSWHLGVSTVLNFICQSSYMPIVWTVFPFFVHVSAAAALRSNTKSRSILSSVASEFRPSALCEASDPDALKPSPKLVFCRGMATVIALVHTVFGILVLSSLNFTMTVDAVLVLLRYIASALVCRFVIMFEIAGMRWSQEQMLKQKCTGSSAVA